MTFFARGTACLFSWRRRSKWEHRDRDEARHAGIWRYCKYNSATQVCLSEIRSGASNGASSLESQVDAEENESTPTVTVTWEKKNEEEGSDDIKKETNGGEQHLKKTMGKDTTNS